MFETLSFCDWCLASHQLQCTPLHQFQASSKFICQVSAHNISRRSKSLQNVAIQVQVTTITGCKIAPSGQSNKVSNSSIIEGSADTRANRKSG